MSLLFELFIIGTLATYRWTAMLNNEAGPGDIFGKLRTRLGVKFDQYSNPYGTNWISEGMLCFYCLSVWVALFISGIIVVFIIYGRLTNHEPPLTFIEAALLVLLPFAMSGGAVYLKKAVG